MFIHVNPSDCLHSLEWENKQVYDRSVGELMWLVYMQCTVPVQWGPGSWWHKEWERSWRYNEFTCSLHQFNLNECKTKTETHCTLASVQHVRGVYRCTAVPGSEGMSVSKFWCVSVSCRQWGGTHVYTPLRDTLTLSDMWIHWTEQVCISYWSVNLILLSIKYFNDLDQFWHMKYLAPIIIPDQPVGVVSLFQFFSFFNLLGHQNML